MKVVVYLLSCFLVGSAARPMVLSVALRGFVVVVPWVAGLVGERVRLSVR
jgi:hypothetical protein